MKDRKELAGPAEGRGRSQCCVGLPTGNSERTCGIFEDNQGCLC